MSCASACPSCAPAKPACAPSSTPWPPNSSTARPTSSSPRTSKASSPACTATRPPPPCPSGSACCACSSKTSSSDPSASPSGTPSPPAAPRYPARAPQTVTTTRRPPNDRHCVGGVISPLLMNVALHGMEQAAGGRYHAAGHRDAGSAVPGSPVVIRYADDLLAFCRSRQEAEQVKARLAGWLAPRGLAFNEDKTRITHPDTRGWIFWGSTSAVTTASC